MYDYFITFIAMCVGYAICYVTTSKIRKEIKQNKEHMERILKYYKDHYTDNGKYIPLEPKQPNT